MALLRHLGTYGFVSAVCVILNIVILVGGDCLGMHYVLSTIISYVFCVLLGYVLHTHFSFESAFSPASFIRYAAAMSVNLPSAVFAVWLLHDMLQIPMFAAAPAATILLTVLNYILNRWAITGKMSIGSKC